MKVKSQMSKFKSIVFSRYARKIINQSNKGFTLLEVLMAVMVSSIAGVLLIQALVSNNGLFIQQTGRVSEGLNLNDASNQISKDIRSSSGVASSYPPSPPYQYNTGLDTLILSIPSIDSSGSIISQTFDYIVYAKDSANPKLLRKMLFPTTPSIRPNVNQILMTNLDSIYFYYYDSQSAITTPALAKKVSFVINDLSQVGITQQTSSTSGEVLLRND